MRLERVQPSLGWFYTYTTQLALTELQWRGGNHCAHMTFLVVLGGVAGVVAGVAAMVVGVWACIAKPVKYQIITKKAAIIEEDQKKPLPPKEWAELNPK